MANQAVKTEHNGHKGNAKGAYWGARVDAKRESNKKRRENSKIESKEGIEDDTRGSV